MPEVADKVVPEKGVSRGMIEFLVNNFEGYFGWIDSNPDHDIFKGDEAQVQHVRENPEVMRRIDYGRFLERLVEFIHLPSTEGAKSYYDSLRLLKDIQATYLTIAKEKELFGKKVFDAFGESQAVSLPEFDQMLISLIYHSDVLNRGGFMNMIRGFPNPSFFWNMKLDLYGLDAEDMEMMPLQGERGERMQRFMEYQIKASQHQMDVWQKYYPYHREITEESLGGLYRRLEEEPHRKDKLRRHWFSAVRPRLLTDFNIVLAGYQTNSPKLEKDLEGALGYVRRLLRNRPFHPLDGLVIDVRDRRTQVWHDYEEAYMKQAVAVMNYLPLLNAWQPKKNDEGRMTLLEGYEDDHDMANIFEAARFLSMHVLSQATLEIQQTTQKLWELTKLRQFRFVEEEKDKLLTPLDIQAYDIFFKTRYAHLHYAEKK